VESPPTVSRKQLAAESDDDLIVTFTSSDDDEEEKKEKYSETDIFGTDYSSDTESSDHDDQEEAQALTAHDDLIAAGSVIIDMLDAEPSQQMQQERLKADEELKHKLQIIAYANFINNHVQKCTGSITPWINFVPWSKHAWLWSEFIAAPPDPPDPPDIPEVSLDEVHAAFAATLPALTVSDTACAQVDAAAATLAAMLIASQMLSTSPLGPRLPWTPPLRLRPLLSMPPLRPLLLLITTPPPPPLRRRPVLASTLGVLCPSVAPTFSTPPP
jgi:hypothetical protein